MVEVESPVFSNGVTITELLVGQSAIFESKGELRRMVSGGGLSINKIRTDDPEMLIHTNHLLNHKYLLVQKGKKNYYLIKSK
jgi:tyrosyl-tRNA synthetase